MGSRQKVSRVNHLERETEYGVFEEREVFWSEWSISQVGSRNNEVRSENKAQRPKVFEGHGKKFRFCPKENKKPLKCSHYTFSFQPDIHI